MAKAKAQTIGSLLPADQAKLLTKKMRNMTKRELETAMNKHPNHNIDHKDMAGVRKLMITRINSGQSALTWTSHNFTTHDVNPQDPSTCSCFS
jgi:hypothetical protein